MASAWTFVTRLARLTVGRAEAVNALFDGVSSGFATVDTQITGKLDKAGGTMTGPIAMGGNKVTGAGDPTSPQDLVTLAKLTATAFSSALPSQTGNGGKFVTTDGTSASWSAPVPFSVITTTANLVVQNRYIVNSASGAVNVTLPASPADGDEITVARIGANAVNILRSGKTISTLASDLTLDATKREVTLIYYSGDWMVRGRILA